MPFITIFATVFLLLLSHNAFAGNMFDMLQRMSEADQKQNYQGTFILRKADNISTLRVVHGSSDKGVWESLEALNGEHKQIIRHNNKVISVFPGRTLITIRNDAKKHTLHQQLPSNIEKLELFYSINRLPDDRIANYQTLVIDLIPNDKLRYGYRYWVDKNTGMLLRCDLVTENNTVVEQMMFTSLDYLPKMPVQHFDLNQFEHYKRQQLDEPNIDAGPDVALQWSIQPLPKGFMMTQKTMRHSHFALHNTEDTRDLQPNLLHLVYSDGLASVSVFIEKNQGTDKHAQGASTIGAVNAFSNVIDDYFVTVVVEVPMKTVQLMAKSIVKLN